MRVRVPQPPFVPRYYSTCHGHLSDGAYLPTIRAELVEIGSDKLGTLPHVLRIANRPPLWQWRGMWFKEPPEGQRINGGGM